ncbi:flagellar filament capping protein FliD [Actinotalea sp. M2MS4P-6]|uniref:flagellar filament capping protein FliD n=1 Tax=Actinotalea sp. M2MS4P-6 TaxID=2983762 RepID=UPI0021E4538C|nr:flagellar filament capping protein FliD [Actinotalea sp. M2MS4P-6]MCV2392796.1 flagellar filament capping protein FliD [Actinotalea sp. M2MS4P-6]
MAGTTNISGIISGMDTASVISQLMKLEAAPQTLLQTKKTNASSLVSALQSFNTKLASLTTTAETAADADSWKAVKATSSATSVSVSTDDTAVASSLSFTVDAVAKPQASLLDVPTSFYTYPPTFRITRSSGEVIEVTADSTALADIVEAFNSASTGLKATSVTANGTSRLQLTGADTGLENAFTVQTQDSGGVWTDLTSTEIQAASDATITLFAGTAAEQVVTQASNTFEDLVRGVDLTVSAEETDPVTITVARDTSSIGTLAKNLVSGLNTVLSEISDRTKSSTTTGSDGSTYTKGGLFSGNSSIREIQQALMAAASTDVSGTSPASIGIELTKDGDFSFDAEKFATALAANPSGVQDMLTAIASAVQTVGDRASDSVYGSITLEIQSQQNIVTDLTDRISDWDDRLALRQATLEKTFTAMEVTLSNLQSQSDWLASQLDALTSTSSNNS